MNPVFLDPDVKINMSLDEIIHLSRQSQLSRNYKAGRKKKRGRISKHNIDSNEHSVPLLSSPCGVGIYVSKKSALLSVQNRRRIAEAISNRAVNSALIEKSKKIIPAEYKLVRTAQGVERILVPTKDYFSKSTQKKLLPPRKLNKQCDALLGDSLPDKPPPLISSPIYSPPPQQSSLNMIVDVDDNEIAIMECPKSKCEVIDVESDLPLDVLEAKKLCVQPPSLMPNNSTKPLSERFSLLTGSFRF